jgi:hypothetical protein
MTADLALLHALLTRAHGSAVEGLTDRTPEGIAAALLPYGLRLRVMTRDGIEYVQTACVASWLAAGPSPAVLDPEDPGTEIVLCRALALAHGLDSRRGVLWFPDGPGYRLDVAIDLDARYCIWFENRDLAQLDDMTDPGGGDGPIDRGHTLFLHVPAVAAINDPTEALIAACRWTVEQT